MLTEANWKVTVSGREEITQKFKGRGDDVRELVILQLKLSIAYSVRSDVDLGWRCQQRRP